MAPTSCAADPAVGIFWFIHHGADFCLVAQNTPLPMAERYADCLTHSGGHYEAWQIWQRRGATWLKQNGFPTEICSSEYEEHPRGRIVFEIPAARFVIYADRALQKPRYIQQLVARFNLSGSRYVVRSDSHYR